MSFRDHLLTLDHSIGDSLIKNQFFLLLIRGMADHNKNLLQFDTHFSTPSRYILPLSSIIANLLR